MNDSGGQIQKATYRAPRFYLALFYGFLTAWTLVSGFLIAPKIGEMNPTILVMITFFIPYTWFWSLELSYRIRMEEDGQILLVSFRRIIRIHGRDIGAVEGPFLPMRFGFIRFRIPGEKAYLFFVRQDPFLRQIFINLARVNPAVEFKRFGNPIR